MSPVTPTQDLRDKFDRAAAGGSLGGASVLEELSGAALRNVTQSDDRRSAVAYALGVSLQILARDFNDRPVTVAEANQLVMQIHDPIAHSIIFLEVGGTSDEVVDLISTLGRIAALRVPIP